MLSRAEIPSAFRSGTAVTGTEGALPDAVESGIGIFSRPMFSRDHIVASLKHEKRIYFVKLGRRLVTAETPVAVPSGGMAQLFSV